MHPKLIAKRLGHASIKLTIDTYGYFFEGSDKEASSSTSRLFADKIRHEAKINKKVEPIRKNNRTVVTEVESSSILRRLNIPPNPFTNRVGENPD